jgi:hypothetical protein
MRRADPIFQANQRPTVLQRAAPVVSLLVLAPWIGEYLLGNVPAGELLALPFLVPLYGGGALLIREVARRFGRGWPSILLLGAAYGVIEAGLVDQSMFNLHAEGHATANVTPVPVLGISASAAISYVIGHAVWSISIPIALVEMASAPARRVSPWLGSVGLGLTTLFYLLGCYIIFADQQATQHFLASPWQLGGAAIAALVLIGAAFVFGTASAASSEAGSVPGPWRLGFGAFVAASLFVAQPENWYGVIVSLVTLGLAGSTLARWSRRQGWSIWHSFAVVAGVLLTYAWLGFVLTSLYRDRDTVAWIGNAVFALAAIMLLAMTAKAIRARDVGR